MKLMFLGYNPHPGVPDAMGDTFSEECIKKMHEYRGSVWSNYRTGDPEHYIGEVVDYDSENHGYIVEVVNGIYEGMAHKLKLAPSMEILSSTIRHSESLDEQGEPKYVPEGFDVQDCNVVSLGCMAADQVVPDHKE
jgi:hypothetical protein